jgi:4-carboxymuconolactone decarboxylase
VAAKNQYYDDKMHEDSLADQLHIQQYLSANCFGDYVSRTGLGIKTRDLLTFFMLLSLGGCEPQLKGHIKGNVNVGNDKQLLLSAVAQLLPCVGYPRALNAIRCINQALSE